ncbi:MAG: hypothetical protein M3Q07_25015, partial [Pseudobdellovibrionaceae bacterium]|nr:hypothetical protein [Pseudobdellovibrionaceae bacterium]
CTGVQLVIATDKLGTAPLKAQIDFHTTSVEISFTPKPISSTLCLDNLAATTGDMLTLRLLQNNALRFIAKRANTAYTPDTTTRIVIDDCLIHAAPWDGRTHDGSCEWTLIDADLTEATLLRK